MSGRDDDLPGKGGLQMKKFQGYRSGNRLVSLQIALGWRKGKEKEYIAYPGKVADKQRGFWELSYLAYIPLTPSLLLKS